ncbi:MAG: 4-alpha-glucanotransferase [Elusimicrobiota bacterium]
MTSVPDLGRNEIRARPALDERAAGILLSISSLPGPHGIGDLGPAAFRFVDFLARSGQRWWQILPIGPTGPGNSPYSSPSAFAGNPLFISLETLAHESILSTEDIMGAPTFTDDEADYAGAMRSKEELLRRAFQRFSQMGNGELWDAFRVFCVRESLWLEDYALFRALKDIHGGQSWLDWERGIKAREFRFWPRELLKKSGEESAFHQFVQWLFARQWTELKKYAAQKGVGIIGDIPLYVSLEGSDAWANPGIFRLDSDFRPEAVAGVPPDYFSEDGQLWGNPLYRWDALAKNGYGWWIERLRQADHRFDAIRIDHFIGFARGWEVPPSSKTARDGHWRAGPGIDFFKTALREIPGIQIIAEDLGALGEDVFSLRNAFGFPGIKVLQFSFSEDGLPIDPFQEYPERTVAYTGTHDNDTSSGWLGKIKGRKAISDYLTAGRQTDPHRAMIEAVYKSPSRAAIIPLQDALGLSSEARMNYPGKAEGNWLWRVRESELNDATSRFLSDLARETGRSRA